MEALAYCLDFLCLRAWACLWSGDSYRNLPGLPVDGWTFKEFPILGEDFTHQGIQSTLVGLRIDLHCPAGGALQAGDFLGETLTGCIRKIEIEDEQALLKVIPALSQAGFGRKVFPSESQRLVGFHHSMDGRLGRVGSENLGARVRFA